MQLTLTDGRAEGMLTLFQQTTPVQNGILRPAERRTVFLAESHLKVYNRMQEKQTGYSLTGNACRGCPDQDGSSGGLRLPEERQHMEWFDIVDEEGEPTGGRVERSQAHALGIRHRTSHVWILRRSENGVQLLLQKRCAEKDSFPGCYDISSAGHIPAGCGFAESALRELREELGVCVREEELISCGKRRADFVQEFHGKPFHDNEVSCVFALWLDREAEEFTVQPEEIERVDWFPLEDCLRMKDTQKPRNCFPVGEILLLREKLGF